MTRLLAALPLLLLGACDLTPNQPGATKATATTGKAAALERQRAMNRACVNATTQDRLKLALFEQAAQLRGGRSRALDTLAAASFVRLDQPVAKSRDEALGVTVCGATLVLQLPPQAAALFNGARMLSTPVEYAAQPAADGSGLVYQLRGAEPVAYRLASLDLRAQGGTAGVAPPTLDPPPPPPLKGRPQPLPVPIPAPVPPPRPDVRPAPVPSATERLSFNPSYDCRRARLRSERLVCGSPRLAELDRRMAALYTRAVGDADPDRRADLRRTRDRFLAYRESCPDEACIAEAYRGRMEEIRDIMR